MKSYTDIGQSKRLVEILPIESADMYYAGHQSIINPKEWEYGDTPKIRGKYISFDDKRIFYPCWSLAALLDILPDRTCVYKKTCKDGRVKYKGVVKGCKELILKDNPVDACYEMVIKLYEQNLL